VSPVFVGVFWVASALFAAGALLTLYRIVRGPSILDRMIASDVLLTTLILVVGAEMVWNGHTRTIPVMLVIAATAVFATIAVARYVSKQDLSTRREITDAEVTDSEVSDADLADADLAVDADDDRGGR